MNDHRMAIRTVGAQEARLLASIISTSFHDVAIRFSLTRENTSKHPSNCTAEWIESDLARGVEYAVLIYDDKPVGCVGVEQPETHLCYMERLSVLPDMRRKGLGAALIRFALDAARQKGAAKVSIGIIAEQIELRNWYAGFGFVDVSTKQFEHLPFKVRFMELNL